MLPKFPPTESGFTLVEALVAATLVATALVTLAHLAATGVRQSGTNARALIALAAAQGKLEQLAAGTLVNGTGEDTGDLLVRWTIAPVAAADSSISSVHVCAYSAGRATDRPDACVATLRARRP
jgi:type II secretory pathway pseudopilin PulG